MLSGRPILRVDPLNHPSRVIDLQSGNPIERIDSETARETAQAYVPSDGRTPSLAGSDLIGEDQWTVSGRFAKDRPLFRFAFDDPARSRLYVSSRSGKAVQLTSRHQRFWNWLGAIPHWLYFTPLRRNIELWTQIVVWSSLMGCFLTVTGLYIGWRQVLRASGGRWSPYSGFMVWHHIPGLIFGWFVLTWVASGLISMNPWGFLDDAGAASERERLMGAPPSGAEVKSSIQRLAAAFQGRDIVRVEAARFDGALYLIAAASDGQRRRLDARGIDAPSPDFARVASLLGATDQTSLKLTSEEDDYYFARHDEPARLPVYRVSLSDAQGTRYYLDPVSAQIIRKVDVSGRWYRWLHDGPHRLDFLPGMRTQPFRYFVMLPLLLGVVAVCGAGAYLGSRRLLRRMLPATVASGNKDRVSHG